MGRKYIDCREAPQEGDAKKCTVKLSADTEEELLEAAMEHGKHTHGYPDTPETRQKLRQAVKEAA